MRSLIRASAVSILAIGIGMVTVAARPSARVSAAAGPYCLGPDAFSAAQVARLQELVTSTDSAYIAFRQSVHVPVVPDTAVHLVTDDSVCSRVVQAWAAADSALGASPPYVAQLYVLSVGPTYVATPARITGLASYHQYVVYDTNFVRLAPFEW